jgi:hypothetical protein
MSTRRNLGPYLRTPTLGALLLFLARPVVQNLGGWSDDHP